MLVPQSSPHTTQRLAWELSASWYLGSARSGFTELSKNSWLLLVSFPDLGCQEPSKDGEQGQHVPGVFRPLLQGGRVALKSMQGGVEFTEWDYSQCLCIHIVKPCQITGPQHSHPPNYSSSNDSLQGHGKVLPSTEPGTQWQEPWRCW